MTNYILIKQNKATVIYNCFADLANGFFNEYGCYPIQAKRQEGINLFYYIECEKVEDEIKQIEKDILILSSMNRII